MPPTRRCPKRAVSFSPTTPAHALALAALRYRGYRSDNRYVVFQALPHTLGLPTETWRLLAKCHERRNLAEYEGVIDVDERLRADLMVAAEAVKSAVTALPPPSPERE